MVYQRTAIVMGGPNVPVKMIQCLPKTIIAQMSSIQYHVQSFHLFEERPAVLSYAACRIRSLSISARTVMGGANSS
ncbi:hypothetical protein D3C87_1770880 [compost metagenome]